MPFLIVHRRYRLIQTMKDTGKLVFAHNVKKKRNLEDNRDDHVEPVLNNNTEPENSIMPFSDITNKPQIKVCQECQAETW